MLQLKLFRTSDTQPTVSAREGVYHFANPKVLGFHFRPSPQDLRDVSLQASRLSLRPILLNAEKFLQLIELGDKMGWRLSSVNVKPDLTDDDAGDLALHVLGVQQGHGVGQLRGYLFELLSEIRGAIESVSFWVPYGSHQIKLSVESRGILYVNADSPALPHIDPVVSMVATSQMGYDIQ